MSFHNPLLKRLSRQLSLDYVIVRDGEPRCALRPGQGKDTISSKVRDHLELCGKDFSANGAKNILTHARTIHLTSIKTNFEDLLTNLLALIPPDNDSNHQQFDAERGLFLDFARAQNDDLTAQIPFLLRLLETERQKILGIFMPGNIIPLLTQLTNTRSLSTLCSYLKLPLIVYGVKSFDPHLDFDGDPKGNDQVHYLKYDGTDNPQVYSVEAHDVGFSYEDIPERFKAGVLLSSSVYRALEDVERVNSDLYKAMKNQWVEDKIWITILSYGLRLASASAPVSGYCSQQSLLATIKRESDHQKSIEKEFTGMKLFSIETSGSSSKKLDLSKLPPPEDHSLG